MSKKNYVALYEGLITFRDAMLAFIKERLETAYGNEWWERGIRRVFPRQDIDDLETTFKRRFTGALGIRRPGIEQHEILDINYFPNIIEGSWKQAFAETFNNDRLVLSWLKEIVDMRNPVAHTETGDLWDDDVWRGLDTIERLLKIINRGAMDEIIRIKSRLRRGWAEVGHQPERLRLIDVGIDYEQGLSTLDSALVQRIGKESSIYLDFLGHRRHLIEALHAEKQETETPEDEASKERALRWLEELALAHLGIPFTDACLVQPSFIAPSPQEARAKLRQLEQAIQGLEHDLMVRQKKRQAQQKTGEIIPSLERAIERTEAELATKREELAALRKEVTPPVYFSVKRTLQPNGARSYVEEQLISVTVELLNLGAQDAIVHYREGLSKEFYLTEGALELTASIRPGMTESLRYECYAICPGRFTLYTDYLDFPGKVSGWDRLDDTTIEVRPGTPPELVAARFFRYHPQGIEIIAQLENRGHRIARQVTLHDIVSVDGQPTSQALDFGSDIQGGAPAAASCIVKVHEPGRLGFAKQASICYRDSNGNQYACCLTDDFKQLEYDFPPTPPLVGRRQEVSRISQIVDQVWRASLGQAMPGPKRLLLLEGIEGSGKTRLVRAMTDLALQRGFSCYVEDAKDRAPIKRMLRRLLGLRLEETNQEVVLERLEERLPSSHRSVRRRQIATYIAAGQTAFDQMLLDELKIDVLTLVNMLCRGPMILVFENVHWIPEGAETELLLDLLHSALVNPQLPLLICVTYRPGEAGPPPVINQLKMSDDHYEKVQIGSLDQESAETLIDQLIEFPRFSRELKNYATAWSKGNPFYLIELLRLLTKPAMGLIARLGGEYYPARDVVLAKVIPDTIDRFILARAKAEEELGGELELLRVLSVIGFELPLCLVERVAAREYPNWQPHDLRRRLHGLTRAGFLVQAREFDGYEFEHQRKREAIYEDDDFPKPERTRLRGEISHILLEQKCFDDPDEQIRQLARHLRNASKEMQTAHLNALVDAARLHSRDRDFVPSMDYYDKCLELVAPDTIQHVELLIERSRVQQMRSNWIAADRDLVSAAKMVEIDSFLVKRDSGHAKRLRTRITKERGRVLLRQNRLDEANDTLYLARKEMEGLIPMRRFFPPKSMDFLRDMVEIDLDLADIWLRKRNYGLTQRACNWAVDLAKRAHAELQDDSLLSSVYAKLGKLNYEQGQHDQALHWYQKALQYADAQKDRYARARALAEMAETYHAKGDPTSAYQCFDDARAAQEEIGDVGGLAISYGGLGDVLVETGKLQQAEYYCEQARKYQQLVGDLDRFARTCLSLAKIHASQGQIDKSLEFWSQARRVLIDYQLFDSLHSRKQKEIYDLLRRFADYYHQREQWEQLRVCLQDLNWITPAVEWHREDQARAKIELGEASLKARQWQDALDAFSAALEMTEDALVRAEIHEWLGDVYVAYDPASRQGFLDSHWEEQLQDQAEKHYEEATQAFVSMSNIKRALHSYEKLLQRVVTDEPGLLQLPFTFLRIFQNVPLEKSVYDQFLAKTESVLMARALPCETGDMFVYVARLLAPLNIPLEDKLGYLHQAEELYRRGEVDELILGYNMLIPTYFRLGQWNEVTRCFEKLFDLNAYIGDAAEFVEGYIAIEELERNLETKEIERFIRLALAGLDQIQPSDVQRADLFLFTAKLYHEISLRHKEEHRSFRFQELSLEYYEKARQFMPDGWVSVILHDTALIYWRRHDIAEALRCLGQAITITEQASQYHSSATSRVMRAELYIEMGRFDEAMADFEWGLDFLTRAVNYWDERLQHQDQAPLSPQEILRMHYEKDWFASACTLFGRFLLQNGNPERARALLVRSAQIRAETDQFAVATVPNPRSVFGITPDILSDLLGDTTGIFIASGWPCPTCGQSVTQGVQQCPACGQNLCQRCGAALDIDSTQCLKCGTQFDVLCPNCQASVVPGSEVCPKCGVTLPLWCSDCGAQVSPEDTACPKCGASFDTEDESAPASAQPEVNRTCPSCGQPVAHGTTDCPHCNQALCPTCGMAVDDEATRCDSCGQALCPSCGGAVDEDAHECLKCGAQFEMTTTCSSCGTEVDADATVCPHCGEVFETDD